MAFSLWCCSVPMIWNFNDTHSTNGERRSYMYSVCGEAALCFKQDEFRVSSRDVLLGVLEETPFYVGAAQYEHLGNTDFVLDVVRGDGDSFSVEASTGVRFLARSVKRPRR